MSEHHAFARAIVDTIVDDTISNGIAYFEGRVKRLVNEVYVVDKKQQEKTPGIDIALEARAVGQERVILFNLSGYGHFDMGAYEAYFAGNLQDYEYPAEAVAEAKKHMPEVVL